jgi:hypothetical protein
MIYIYSIYIYINHTSETPPPADSNSRTLWHLSPSGLRNRALVHSPTGSSPKKEAHIGVLKRTGRNHSDLEVHSCLDAFVNKLFNNHHIPNSTTNQTAGADTSAQFTWDHLYINHTSEKPPPADSNSRALPAVYIGVMYTILLTSTTLQ